MRWGVNSKGGWFDLDRGVMYRRGEGELDSNKRRVPAPIPDRLRPHLKRWRKMTTTGPVEYAGSLSHHAAGQHPNFGCRFRCYDRCFYCYARAT